MTAVDISQRWGVEFRTYPWTQCLFCGRSTEPNRPTCAPTTCLACGSRVCLQPRECPVCYVGLLVGVSYANGRDAVCGYAGCEGQAVAKAPRVRLVCGSHLERPASRFAGRRVTVAEYIAERIDIRDGKVREKFPVHRYVLRPEVPR